MRPGDGAAVRQVAPGPALPPSPLSLSPPPGRASPWGGPRQAAAVPGGSVRGLAVPLSQRCDPPGACGAPPRPAAASRGEGPGPGEEGGDRN